MHNIGENIRMNVHVNVLDDLHKGYVTPILWWRVLDDIAVGNKDDIYRVMHEEYRLPFCDQGRININEAIERDMS